MCLSEISNYGGVGKTGFFLICIAGKMFCSQTKDCQVDGYVFDEFNRPVQKAQVLLSAAPDVVKSHGVYLSQYAFTDEDGYYSLRIPPNISYSLSYVYKNNELDYTGIGYHTTTSKSERLPDVTLKEASLIYITDNRNSNQYSMFNFESSDTEGQKHEFCMIDNYDGPKGKGVYI